MNSTKYKQKINKQIELIKWVDEFNKVQTKDK